MLCVHSDCGETLLLHFVRRLCGWLWNEAQGNGDRGGEGVDAGRRRLLPSGPCSGAMEAKGRWCALAVSSIWHRLAGQRAPADWHCPTQACVPWSLQGPQHTHVCQHTAAVLQAPGFGSALPWAIVGSWGASVLATGVPKSPWNTRATWGLPD